MFLALTILTALVGLRAMTLAYHRTRDPFHPLVIIVPMLLSLYVFLPLKLFNQDVLASFISDSDLVFVQFVNLLGVTSFCLGCSTAKRRKVLQSGESLPQSPIFRQRIYNGALVLGGIGGIAYVTNIMNVGGFYAAYSQGYGGGWSETGYLRDAVSLCVPAVVFILISRTGQKLSLSEMLTCFMFALPSLIQGLLGARRGPTFLIIAAVGLSWYMMRHQRPRPAFLAVTGLALAFLMLFLVANRESIHLGSDWEVSNSGFDYLNPGDAENGTGNEYIYGAGSILHASITEDYYWGRRYFAEVFIRPIPRQVWPDKYRAMGLDALEEANAGTGGEAFLQTLGWAGSVGAAPGLIADVWIEFWWFFFVVLYGIGRVYERTWHLACTRGGLSTAIYAFLVSLSIYMVFQTIEAILVKLVFMSIPSWLVWQWAKASLDNATYSPEQLGSPVESSFKS